MSQTKVWTASHSTTVRRNWKTKATSGSGHSERLYVGRNGHYDYDSMLDFNVDWTDVGSLVSAILTVYTDDGGGVISLPTPESSDTPRVNVADASSDPTWGGAADGTWAASNWSVPTNRRTANRTGTVYTAREANGVTNIDITALVKAKWMPATVAGGSGTNAQALARVHGLILNGNSDTSENWAGWSKYASDSSKRPFITITHELGPTTPYDPSSMTPSGAVDALDYFEGDFSDPRATDTLFKTDVQVFTNGGFKSGSATASNNHVNVTAHGYSQGQEVWFTSLTGGSGLSEGTRYYVRYVSTDYFRVSKTPAGAVVDVTSDYSAIQVASPMWALEHKATETEVTNDHFTVAPNGDLHLRARTNYKWRARYMDQEKRWSAWSSLVQFQTTNTDPNAPTGMTPATGASFASLAAVKFQTGAFDDADAGDRMSAFEMQLSAYPDGDSHWDDPTYILWTSGRVFLANGETTGLVYYGGKPLDAGSYYWRCRVYDSHGGVSDWHTNAITLTADFNPKPGTEANIQILPQTPWRIRIREMEYNSIAGQTGAVTGSDTNDTFTTAKNHKLDEHQPIRFSALTGGSGLVTGKTYYVLGSGLTSKAFKISDTDGGAAVDLGSNVTAATITTYTTRGPGNTVAVLYDAANPGASKVYNSPGEMHFTVPKNHPQIGVIEPKQTHYGIDFWTGDGWKEAYAGLVDDTDNTERDVVVTGIDYLGLTDLHMDERYDPSQPNRTYTKGGSYYNDKTIKAIVTDQLNLIRHRDNSPVGFIGVGNIDDMDEHVTTWSTMVPTLSFITQLLDSHRRGSAKKTRLEVVRTSSGGYEYQITDDPGQTLDNLRLAYGELVQGYRVIPFGPSWASVMHAIGRTREGLRVFYKTSKSPAISENIWGRIARAIVLDNVSDENDLERRCERLAIKASKLGSKFGVAIRTGFMGPFNGYDITDSVPCAIVDGPVDTTRYGSGYWDIYAVAWEGSDDGQQNIVLTLLPREDQTTPSSDLSVSQPISPQPEWQIGWEPPDPITATGQYYYDGSTGKVYIRDDESSTPVAGYGTATTTDTLFYAPGHGLSAGDRIYFGNTRPEDTGIIDGHIYYVLADGLTTNYFKISETDGGAAIVLDNEIESTTVTLATVYTALDDSAIVMRPPSAVPTPLAGPTLSSSTIGGVVKIAVTLAVPTDTANRLRTVDVELTHKYDDGASAWDWDRSQTIHLVPGVTDFVQPALPSTTYAGRQRYVDTYGNHSDWSEETTVNTVAGNDALYAGQSDFANDIPTTIIDGTYIQDDSIETHHIKANQITANLLAAEIILATLFKTAASGTRRVEIDSEGIRLLDSDDTPIVIIPTNGDPVYVAGDLVASSLTALDNTSIRGTAELASGAVMTLAQGITNPSSAPNVSTSVPYWAMGSTPSELGRGIAYDSTNEYYWVACDPTASGGYIAKAFDSHSGAYVGGLTKTGSFATYSGTVGSTSHIRDTAQAQTGSTKSQIATPISMPTGLSSDGTLRITKVSAYFAGYGGSCTAQVAIWDTGGNMLRHSDNFTAAYASFAVGHSTHYNKNLSSSRTVNEGDTIWAGFLHTSSGEGFQWDRDDGGSSKVTKNGSGLTGDMTSITTDTGHKPNVYVSYEYDVDTVLEGFTAEIIGIAVHGTYLWALEKGTGKVYAYDLTVPWDSAYIGTYDMSSHMGQLDNASLYYDVTDNHIVIVSATDTSSSANIAFIHMTQSGGALTYYAKYTSNGKTIDGASDLIAGCHRTADALAGSGQRWWVAVGGQVYAFTASTSPTYQSNRDFGSSTTVATGLCGVNTTAAGFRGYNGTSYPGRVWQFTDWDWTTATTTWGASYAWYSITHAYKTKVGPAWVGTIRRHERVTVTMPDVPGGDADRNVVYMYLGGDPGSGAWWSQGASSSSSRTFSAYPTTNHDGTTNTFPSNSNAELKADSGAWSLKGDGTATFKQATLAPVLTRENVTISSQQNNWAPTGIHQFAFWRVNPHSTPHITGIDAGTNGELLYLEAAGTTAMVLDHESASSSAGNRIHVPGNSNLTVDTFHTATLVYESVNGIWLVIAYT